MIIEPFLRRGHSILSPLQSQGFFPLLRGHPLDSISKTAFLHCLHKIPAVLHLLYHSRGHPTSQTTGKDLQARARLHAGKQQAIQKSETMRQSSPRFGVILQSFIFATSEKCGFFGEEDEEREAVSNKQKQKKGCNQHAVQPGGTVGNKGQIDNKQGEPVLIADKIQHPAQWKPIIMPDKITAEEVKRHTIFRSVLLLQP
ncbi:MAG: hypothetical protein IJA81_00025 [Akkermansia sp.]|nr:hypothetical protein [Akkermansia sp.]